jgi:uncharacterized protein DUF4271
LQIQLEDVTKFFSSFFLCFFFLQALFAQSGADSGIIKRDSVVTPKKIILKKDTSGKTIRTLRVDTSSIKKDSLPLPSKDSVLTNKIILPLQSPVLLFRKILQYNAWFNFSGKPQVQFIEEHKPDSEDGLFYLLVGIVLYFALIRVFFAKYLGYLTSLFFRASMRQQQIREQLLQAPLPSLLLNILFVATGGLYICFIAGYYQLAQGINFWLLLTDCSALVGLLYLIKFFVLKTTGWIFNITKATDTYIFIVFLANKILGILLMPILIVIAFSGTATREITVTLSFIMVAILFLYRFIASYPSIRNEIKVSILYFFLYLCAFEIAPLLLIYKVLLTYLEKAY